MEVTQKTKIRWAIEVPKEAYIEMDFPNILSQEDIQFIEREVSNDEIKKAVWDCGTDKASGPDGFTFEVVLGGSKFTWCHKSGSKMSKLDKFLISKNLMYTYPNINAITLPRGDGNDEIMCKRSGIINNLNDLSNIQTMEVTQKTKIRWAIEFDENSSFFHGMLNKKRRTLNVRGVLVD
nr:RNA-directed DNA polymerase, eukaryota [Tanacetum cinerariifolium]